jgi:hypothetical protein
MTTILKFRRWFAGFRQREIRESVDAELYGGRENRFHRTR